MLYNYLKISFRNIKKHKLFSFINIFGLALSITICLSVIMIIKHQFSLDEFHPHPDNTYRIITEVTYDNGRFLRYATSALPLANKLEDNYGFIATTARFYRAIFARATANGKKLSIRGSFTGPSFFKIFGFELKWGNPATALDNPYSIILSQKTARRFFGGKNPIGESFSIEGMGNFTVTGVLKPILEQTHLKFDVLASFSTVPLIQENKSFQNDLKQWFDFHYYPYMYVLTKPEAGPNALKEILSALSNNIAQNYKLGQDVKNYNLEAQTLEDISPGGAHLRYDIGAGKVRSFPELLFLGSFAFIILLMACFNYTNLSIARALKRSKEVGMSKIWGAGRFQIISQFVVQSTLITVISLILAYALLPFIPLEPDMLEEVNAVIIDFELFIWFVLFALFTGLLAGLLPGWLLSSINPVKAFKNVKSIELIKGLTIRKMLVVAQFALSLILIITIITTYRQSQFAATTDYGFRKENIISLNLQGTDYSLLKNEISNIAGVKQVAAVSKRFGIFADDIEIKKDKSSPPINVQYFSVGQNIIETMDLTLIAGSDFPKGISAGEERFIIVNEKLVSVFNWKSPSQAVGKTIWLNDSTQVQIAGVLKNFNYETLSFRIRPMIFRYNPDKFNYLNIQLASSNTGDVIPKIKAIWEKVAPLQSISYSYIDDYLYRAYSYQQTNAMVGFYAFLAITIACLGLLGMVTYTVEVRTREVGIRKVLGASVREVIFLLSKEFIWLLALAGSIGLPIGYWIGLQFLQSYAYHITLGFGLLIAGLAIMLFVGLLAIGFQTWKVAQTNPVDTLKTEG